MLFFLFLLHRLTIFVFQLLYSLESFCFSVFLKLLDDYVLLIEKKKIKNMNGNNNSFDNSYDEKCYCCSSYYCNEHFANKKNQEKIWERKNQKKKEKRKKMIC
jgi:hypothetical protein